jgi:DNA polymerase-3 subunit alpha
VDVLLRTRGERAVPSRLTLLCKDTGGYQNVTNLITRAWLEGQERGAPLIDRSWLDATTTAGLIALSGATEGDVGRALMAGREAEALGMAREWQALFGDRYYLELQRLGRADDETHVTRCVALSEKTGIAVVATNDVRFLAAADFESHEARVCIAEGTQLADPARPRRYTEAQYLRSPEEMARLFADLPEALRNSVEIARRCSLPLKLGESRLPVYPLPDGVTVEDFIRAESLRGYAAREQAFDEAQRGRIEEYRARLDSELAVISKMGFAGCFLIVAMVHPLGARQRSAGGAGPRFRRGFAGGLQPWHHRHRPAEIRPAVREILNPERVSMPDFDIDFCMDGRDRVIEYVSQKYGRERVSQIITYGTMAAKAVVRDVGRVLGMGYGYVDKIAKLIPFELGITLDDALRRSPSSAAVPGRRGDQEPHRPGEVARGTDAQRRHARRWRGDRTVEVDRVRSAVRR